MAILKIAKMGHPVLRKVAEPVSDPSAPEIRHLVDDMRETLEDIGGNGLAAPQVYVSKRVVLYRLMADRMPRSVTVLGSTGSVGTQTIDLLLGAAPGRFSVRARVAVPDSLGPAIIGARACFTSSCKRSWLPFTANT